MVINRVTDHAFTPGRCKARC